MGKTHLLAAWVAALWHGYMPWNGTPLPARPPVSVAALLTDFDNAAVNVYKKLRELIPREDMSIKESTQTHAPRVLEHKPTGSVLHCFTQDQDVRKLEGGTWDALVVDEPAPRSHFIALYRGLQKTHGKTLFTLTPLSEPWIKDDYYDAAANMDGDKKHVFSITAWPEENLKSNGGHLEDAAVEEFWASLSPEEMEARKYGRWMHLIGRVFKTFQDEVHVIDEDVGDPETCPWGLSVDPHDRLPFAMGFYYVTPGNDIVFRHEWPTEDFNELRSCDMTVDNYVHVIQSFPHTSFRQMDPNYGRRADVQTGLTIAEMFQVKGLFFNTRIVDDIAAGHKAVRDRLAYDKERDMGPDNQPKIYIHRSCRNIIKAFHNYIWDEWKGRIAEGKSPKQKPKEDYKHFADVVRYACMDPYVRFIEPAGSSRSEILTTISRSPRIPERVGMRSGSIREGMRRAREM